MAKVLAAETRADHGRPDPLPPVRRRRLRAPGALPGHPGGTQHRLRNPSYRGRRMAAPDDPQTLPGAGRRAAIVGAGPPGFYAADQLLERGLRGRPARRAADAVRARARGRRARPPEDQVGHARLREDRARKPGFRFFGGVELGRATSRARSCSSATTRSLRGRHGGRQPARHPRRGPARLARGHRVRRLVQRPPRLRRPRVRPRRAAARS